MCVALPGIVEKIEDKTALVNFSGNKVNAFAGFCPIKVGDRVLVHAGCILQTVTQTEAEEIESILADMGELFSADGVTAPPQSTGVGYDTVGAVP